MYLSVCLSVCLYPSMRPSIYLTLWIHAYAPYVAGMVFRSSSSDWDTHVVRSQHSRWGKVIESIIGNLCVLYIYMYVCMYVYIYIGKTRINHPQITINRWYVYHSLYIYGWFMALCYPHSLVYKSLWPSLKIRKTSGTEFDIFEPPTQEVGAH